MPGYIPEYEAREAARFALCSWSEFQALEYWNRVYTIAHYRYYNLVERHVQEAVNKPSRRNKDVE